MCPASVSNHSDDVRHQVMNRWPHQDGPKIAGDLGLKIGEVHAIVGLARKQGDIRAVQRFRHPPAVIEAILDRWVAKEPSKTIAHALGLHDGYVRSVVFRARAGGDPRAARRGPELPAKPRQARSAAPARRYALVLREDPVEPLFKTAAGGKPAFDAWTVVDLDRRSCKFGVAEDPSAVGGHRFCGRPVVLGKSYCLDHARRCFTPVGAKAWYES